MKEEEVKVSLEDAGFLCGIGLFETMRAYNKKIAYFNRHLERILASSRLLKLKPPYSFFELKRLIREALEKNNIYDAYLRLTLWRSEKGASISIITRKYNPLPLKKYRKGFSTSVSRYRQSEGSLLAGLKTTSRLLYELSYQEARFKGFDEAIILNNRGNVTEASRSNIFLIKSGVIFTPAQASGCLAGITRRAIFDLSAKYKLEISQTGLTVNDFYGAEEAFLTNSLIGVMPLESVEKRIIGKGVPGRITAFLMKKYNHILRNGD